MKKILISIIILQILACNEVPNNISVKIIANKDIKLITRVENIESPIVIIVPGSGGSYIPNEKLFGLVKSGYDVLSIAYFGTKKLPRKMELIPLEYLEKVVLWSKSQFPERKIVLLGISKGAEYSLTFASNFDLIDGLICYAPSSFVLPNHIGLKKKESQKSSWSFNGSEVPFAELTPFNDKAGKIVYKKYISPIFSNDEQKNKSRIKVENIKCNVLLLSGKNDLVWPSYEMANLITEEIENNNHSNTVKHASYENCGHQFVWFNEEIPEKRTEYQSINLTGIKKHKFLYGGTNEGTIKAMINSRNIVISFLEDIKIMNNNYKK